MAKIVIVDKSTVDRLGIWSARVFVHAHDLILSVSQKLSKEELFLKTHMNAREIFGENIEEQRDVILRTMINEEKDLFGDLVPGYGNNHSRLTVGAIEKFTCMPQKTKELQLRALLVTMVIIKFYREKDFSQLDEYINNEIRKLINMKTRAIRVRKMNF